MSGTRASGAKASNTKITAAGTAGIGMTSARTQARMIERLVEQGIRDKDVLAAMEKVPRHLFVEPALASRAYEDTALPIGLGQTISQPYIVARMIEVARNGKKLDKVLEVGTGCGYQAAVLSYVAKEVYSVERIAPMMEKARNNLRGLRLPNVRMKHTDGQNGLPEGAPYNAIIVAAAATAMPLELMQQLAVGGRMVLPLVGSASEKQQVLCLIERTPAGFRETRLEPVHFVPLLKGVV